MYIVVVAQFNTGARYQLTLMMMMMMMMTETSRLKSIKKTTSNILRSLDTEQHSVNAAAKRKQFRLYDLTYSVSRVRGCAIRMHSL